MHPDCWHAFPVTGCASKRDEGAVITGQGGTPRARGAADARCVHDVLSCESEPCCRVCCIIALQWMTSLHCSLQRIPHPHVSGKGTVMCYLPHILMYALRLAPSPHNLNLGPFEVCGFFRVECRSSAAITSTCCNWSSGSNDSPQHVKPSERTSCCLCGALLRFTARVPRVLPWTAA